MPIKGSTKRSYKTTAQKNRVLRRRLKNNETIRNIARAENMDTSTVLRILTLPEVEQKRIEGRQIILESIAEMATRLVQLALGKRPKGMAKEIRRTDRQALIEGLKGIGVLTAKFEMKAEAPGNDGIYEGKSWHEIMYHGLHREFPNHEQLAAFQKAFPQPKFTKMLTIGDEK